MKIGFIGQGFIGKNMADDFERRGYNIVRHCIEKPNLEEIKKCNIVFIAVPTPTTPQGFDYSIIKEVLSLVGKGKTAVIKSTILPRTTEKLQKEYPDIYVLHSPEFLREEHAGYDTSNPERNIIGIPVINDTYLSKANEVIKVLPEAPYCLITISTEAEFIKYIGNYFLYAKVILMNTLYDLVKETDCDWDKIKEAVLHDPRIGRSHTDILDKKGRGAGGHCFIKDSEALLRFHKELLNDKEGLDIMIALREKNLKLLKESCKDLDLIEGIYENEDI